jgi:hypothetical protein
MSVGGSGADARTAYQAQAGAAWAQCHAACFGSIMKLETSDRGVAPAGNQSMGNRKPLEVFLSYCHALNARGVC